MSIISYRRKLLNYFKPETWKMIIQVERDYFKLFKIVMKISTFSLVLFLLHRQIPYFNTFEIEYVKNDKNKLIVESLLPIDYRPTIYLPSCYAQMIYNEIKNNPEVEYKREFLTTHDDGVISLDWLIDNKGKQTKQDKIMVILHGLTGGSECSYIKETALAFQENGFKVVAVNYRGINDTPLLTPMSYHPGYTEDIYTAMMYIKSKYPDLRCYTLGTSMGANIFTKLFAVHDDFNEYVKGFISVSNPLNCLEIEKRLRGGILDSFLVSRQLSYVKKHRDVFKDIIDIEKLLLIKNYRDFDELVTLKLFAFESLDHYYTETSSLSDVQHLKINSIFFNAQNDKLSPVETLDLESTFRKNPNIILVMTKWGGHVCWFEGFLHPKRWFIDKSLKYVEALEALEKVKLDNVSREVSSLM